MKLEMYRTVAELDIRLGVVSVRYGYRDMSLRDVTEVVRPLSLCLVSLVGNTHRMSLFSTRAGGTGPAGGSAADIDPRLTRYTTSPSAGPPPRERCNGQCVAVHEAAFSALWMVEQGSSSELTHSFHWIFFFLKIKL